MTPILFVHAKGGPPLEYAVPRIVAHAEVHVLALASLPRTTESVWLPGCASVTTALPGEGRNWSISSVPTLAASAPRRC
ncbi:hypothetical protein ACU4GG_40585 [Streptomyces nojiriensis]